MAHDLSLLGLSLGGVDKGSLTTTTSTLTLRVMIQLHCLQGLMIAVAIYLPLHNQVARIKSTKTERSTKESTINETKKTICGCTHGPLDSEVSSIQMTDTLTSCESKMRNDTCIEL